MTLVIPPGKPQAIAALENDDLVLLHCDLDFAFDHNPGVFAYAPAVFDEFGCALKPMGNRS